MATQIDGSHSVEDLKPGLMMSSHTIFFSFFAVGIILAFNSFAQGQNSNLRAGFDDPITDLIVESGGVVWIPTHKGLYWWRVGATDKPDLAVRDARSIQRIEEFGGVVWISSLEGLFYWKLGAPDKPRPVGVDTGIISKILGSGGLVWFGGEKGLFQWKAGATDKLLPVGVDTGSVSQILESGGVVWFGGEKGLFHWKVGASDKPLSAGVDTGKISQILESGGVVWFGGEKGLFHWKVGGAEKPLPVGVFTGPVRTIAESRESVWIDTNLGLFRWAKGIPGPPRRMLPNLSAMKVLEAGSVVWISGGQGLFRWNKESPWSLNEVKGPPFIGHVMEFVTAGGVVWFGGEKMPGKTLFWWPIGSVDPPTPTGLETGSISQILESGGVVWIGTEKGLFHWKVGASDNPLPAGVDTGRISQILESGGVVWFGAEKGLFHWKVGATDKLLPVGLDTGFVRKVVLAGNEILIDAEKGLYQLSGSGSSWKTRISLMKNFPEILYPDTPLPVDWKIEDFGRRTTPDIVLCRVLVFDRNSQAQTPIRDIVLTGKSNLTLEPLPPGDYRIVVDATDLWGEVARSDPLEFHVYAHIWEVIGKWFVMFVVGYLVLTLLVFLGFVVAFPWSGRSLELLTSTWVLRFGIYYGWALGNLPPLQVWILARYYRSARHCFEEPTDSHVPRFLSRPQPSDAAELQQPGMQTTSLLNELRREHRIWITGGPGTGKTETVGEVLRRYFTPARSVWGPWWKFGFIPVLVRLRDLPETSLEQILIDSLSRHGVSFGDGHLARNFIRSAPLLVILDGVNEAQLTYGQLQNWLPKFLKGAPKTRILATSQTPDGSGDLLRYEMPLITAEIAGALLRAFLGNNAGNAVYAAAPPELWTGPDQLTAYEVRQVADLARARRPVPTNRTELYRATLESATEGNIRCEAIRETLSRLAWDAWLQGRYRFSASADLPEPLPTNLLGPVLVNRGVGSDGNSQYEFVHQLMRAYLAARWAVVYATSPVARLDDEEVWRPSPSRDNEPFFNFLAELISTVKTMSMVGRFALRDPKQRGGLLESLVGVAQRRKWELALSTDVNRNGVCAFVPRHQEGYRPKVIGMGILVDDLEVITCAHVVDQAIGEGWFEEEGEGVVRVCFPFTKGAICVSGTVDRQRYFRAEWAEEGKLTDIAVVQLQAPAPAVVGRATLKPHANGDSVQVFGFPSLKSTDSDWESHPLGENLVAKILDGLVGGLVDCEVTEPSGANVEPGFSGTGLYCIEKDAFVGMMVMSSKSNQKRTAQFICVDHLWKALKRCKG